MNGKQASRRQHRADAPLKVLGVDVEAFRFDIDEHGLRAQRQGNLGGGGEAESGHEDGGPGADIFGHEGDQ